MIEAQAVAKSFGNINAVNCVSFSAANGKVTALLGPNGAGKSTTLRMLSGIIKPTSGRALIDDVNVAQDPIAIRKLIGVLPHNAGLYGRLTATENIEYFGRLQGLDKSQLARRIDALVELLEMGDFCHRRCAGFSQGQKIKVALARALVHDPMNVLLDEPTNGLDVMATRALREIIGRLKAEGRCVLFSSHIMQEVANLSDDVVIIGHGEVRFDGTLEALQSAHPGASLEDAFVNIVEDQPTVNDPTQ